MARFLSALGRSGSRCGRTRGARGGGCSARVLEQRCSNREAEAPDQGSAESKEKRKKDEDKTRTRSQVMCCKSRDIG